MYFNQKKISPIILFIAVTLIIGIVLFIINFNHDLIFLKIEGIAMIGVVSGNCNNVSLLQ